MGENFEFEKNDNWECFRINKGFVDELNKVVIERKIPDFIRKTVWNNTIGVRIFDEMYWYDNILLFFV